LGAIRQQQRPHVVGGMADLSRFATAAQALMDGRATYHEDLAPFDTWPEVLDYVKNDMLGAELANATKLVEEHTPEGVIELADRMSKTREQDASVVISTAHKSKGRQWPTVRLADDFPAPKKDTPPAPEEMRLLYVAATRAQTTLDPFSAWPWGQS
jgi:superfamily I DNA/RNA helicase